MAASKLKVVTENLSLKLFSLAVAILLFMFVSVESTTPVDVDFPVKYNPANGVIITNNPPQVIHTTLQGPWASLRSFELADLPPVVIDLTRDGPGTVRHIIETTHVQAPGGMKVVSVRPSEIEIKLDREIERLVPVRVSLKGEAAPDFVLESFSSDPPSVRVLGPSSAMQSLEYITTQEVDIDGRADNLTVEVGLREPAAPLRIKDKRVVRVSVVFTEEVVTKSFDNLPVAADGAPSGTKLVPDKVSIKLKGPTAVVDSLDPLTLQAYVEVQPEYDEGQASFDKVVKLRGQPERAQWVGQAPKVTVQIPKAKVKKPTKKR